MTRNPRVLMIGWELPPHNSGGLGTACAAMAQALIDDGWELRLTLPYAASDYPANLTVVPCTDCAKPAATAVSSVAGGASVMPDRPPFNPYVPEVDSRRRPRGSRLLAGPDLPPPGSAMEDQVDDYARAVLAYARQHATEFDVIHAHDWMTMPAALLVHQQLGKPYVAHIHSTEYDRSFSHDRSTYIGQCELAGMRHADRVLAVSYYTKRLLVEEYGINPDKIDVVHNGVVRFVKDLGGAPRQFAYRRPVIVFMGRLTVQKGPDYFLKLAAKIVADRPDALFIVSGMGDMYQHLLLSTAHHALSANVLFSGFVRGGAQQAILQRADVFVMPSVSEPFGLVATEAAAQQTPVIASKNSGVVEVIPGSPQFDFWDIDAMAAEVLHLLDDPDYRQRVVEQQLRDLDQHTWQKMARQLGKIYSSVTAKKPRTRRRRKA